MHCTRRDWNNGKDIESLPLLALFVFCSEAVPTYSSRSQNTKFISLSQSLNQYNLKYINFMHKYTGNIPKILTLYDYCDKLLTRLEIIVSFIMSLKTKYGGK